jgi:hypothetical protein
MTSHSQVPLYVVVFLSAVLWLMRRGRVRGTGWFIATVIAMCGLSALMIWLLAIQLHVTH